MYRGDDRVTDGQYRSAICLACWAYDYLGRPAHSCMETNDPSTLYTHVDMIGTIGPHQDQDLEWSTTMLGLNASDRRRRQWWLGEYS